MTIIYCVVGLLLFFSWLFSLVMAFFFGQVAATNNMQKHREAMFQNFFKFIEGVKNEFSSGEQPGTAGSKAGE